MTLFKEAISFENDILIGSYQKLQKGLITSSALVIGKN